MVSNAACQPNFMIVGAPKCGTTSLYEYLQTHPQVYMTEPKEPHFYAADVAAHRSVFTREEYRLLFSRVGPQHSAVGEASAWYLHSSVALPQIARELPDVKLVVMLRQPVEMLRSLHSDMVWICFEDETDFERAWSLQDSRAAGHNVPRLCQVPWFLQYGELGRLGQHTRRLLELVPRERVKFFLLDDLKATPQHVYHETLEFLGLPDDGRNEFPRMNASKRNRSQWLARLQATVVRGLPRAYVQAGKRIGLGELNRAITVLNYRHQGPASGSEQFHRQLLAEFHDDICELEHILRRNLDHWKS